MSAEQPGDETVDVRRPEDDELCGRVVCRDGTWLASTVFGAVLGVHGDREAAEEQLLREGIACLADRWTLRHCATDETEIVCIIEANPMGVTVACNAFTYPGVPLLNITIDQITAREWELHRL